ncbi:secretory lipase [Blastomyces dermatitidis ATCC 18188]|uniref:Secretory lipase n=1 Tax=Ajellomyces dermatitidis (strain ATCC 18188 / CBS 674.68) TaxID=653446 RepID=F2T6M9_AJEDA|nr:secretory lipase [Blastomyces dermatitidis ATCC 18188]
MGTTLKIKRKDINSEQIKSIRTNFENPALLESFQPWHYDAVQFLPICMQRWWFQDVLLKSSPRQDSCGKISVDSVLRISVSTLIVLRNSDPSQLLVFQAAYCRKRRLQSIIYTLRPGSATGGLLGVLMPNSTVSIDVVFLAVALNQGWWVMVTDYEGLHAQLAAGPQSGYATLDSVRVVLNEGRKIGLAADVRYAIWGYSEGSLAGGSAAELQPPYAPELHFTGAALGSIIINGGIFSGRLFRGFYGLAKTYQNLTAWMDENVLPDKRAEFFKHATNCQIQGIDGAFHDIISYFIDGERPIYEPVPASVLDWSGQMGRRGIPTMPLFMYKAFGDEISPVEDTDKLVHKYCSNRATFEYYRNLIGGHVTEAIIGSVNALEWVSDHLAGRPVRNLGSCRTENVLITKI